MKKVYLLILLSILTSGQLFSQITWEKLISYKSTDQFRHVQEVSTGGYIAAGYISDSTVNDTDAYIGRFDVNGDTTWTFVYNGTLSGKDLFYKVKETTDGGFIACGYTTSVTGISDDVLYIKLNSTGQMQWMKSYGGNGKERAQDVVETTDGFTIAGYTTTIATYYDALIIHTNFNGDVQWTKTVGGSNYDDANSMKLLADGGYILGGQSNDDQFLIRITSLGDTLWTKRFGTAETDNIESLVLVSDGFVIAGSTSTVTTHDDGYIVKTDTSGNVIWTKSYGGDETDDFHSINQTADGGFILAGTTSSSGPPDPNIWLFKTNATGDSSWTKVIHSPSNHDHGYFAIQTSDGGYMVVGHEGNVSFRHEDAYIAKLDNNGILNNKLTYVTAQQLTSPTCSKTETHVIVEIRNFGNENLYNIPVTVNLTGGYTYTFDTIIDSLHSTDVLFLDFSPTINTVGVGPITFNAFTGIDNDVYPANNSFTKTVSLAPCVGIDEISRSLGFSVYPNPANDNLQIDFSETYLDTKIEVYNSTGIIVKQLSFDNTFGLRKSIDLSMFSSGLYLLKVSTEKGFDVRRIIVEH